MLRFLRRKKVAAGIILFVVLAFILTIIVANGATLVGGR